MLPSLPLLLLLPFLAIQVLATPKVWATVGIQSPNPASPPFSCNVNDAGVLFKPLGSKARFHGAGGNCSWSGVDVAGDYVANDGHGGVVVVKGLDLAHPVRVRGDQVVFADSFASGGGCGNSDLWYNAWDVDEGVQCSRQDGLLRLAMTEGGVGVRSVPRMGRTFNFFRGPLQLNASVANFSPTTGVRLGIAGPTLQQTLSANYTPPVHYLGPPSSGEEGKGSGGGGGGWVGGGVRGRGEVGVEVRAGEVCVVVVASASSQPNRLSCEQISCTISSISTTIDLFNVSARVSCEGEGEGGGGGWLEVAPVQHGLDWLRGEEGGFGDVVGEGVLVLGSAWGGGGGGRESGGVGESESSGSFGGRVRKEDVDLKTKIGGEDESEGRKQTHLPLDSKRRIKGSAMGDGIVGKSDGDGDFFAGEVVVFGGIWVASMLEPNVGPAVLAPITDQSGIFPWDFGELGEVHGEEVGFGILDPSLPPFDADASGVRDATMALQAALEFARFNYMAVQLPVGVFSISDTLNATQFPRATSNGMQSFNSSSNYCNRFLASVLRGTSATSDSSLPTPSSALPRAHRSTLLLRASSALFSNGSRPRALLNVSNVNHAGALQPNINMAQVVASLDLVVERGNPAAVGLRMRGAQGTSTEDVAVFAATDAFAGFQGCPGSGGAHSNLTVVGARFGLDLREAQPGPSIANARLFNQSCAAIVLGGFESMALAGIYAETNHSDTPLIAAGANSNLPLPPKPSPCHLQVPFPDGQKGQLYNEGTLSIAESVFHCAAAPNCSTLVHSTRALYVTNSFLSPGFTSILTLDNASSPSASPILRIPTPTFPKPKHHLHIQEFSTSQPFPSYPGPHQHSTSSSSPSSSPFPSIVVLNGSISTTTLPALFSFSFSAAPDVDALTSAFTWGDNGAFPSLDKIALMENVWRHGAVGNGVADDTAALVSALRTASSKAQHPWVFFPRGTYRVSSPLTVPAGVSLIGVARHLTTLTSSLPFPSSPLLTFAAGSHPKTQHLVGLTVTLPLSATNASAWRWEGGGTGSSMRQFWQTRRPVTGECWTEFCHRRWDEAVATPYSRSLTQIVGEAAKVNVVVFYNEDGYRNGGMQHGTAPAYHKLEIANTTQRIRILMLNGEHGPGEAYTRIHNASGGVLVASCKSEMASEGTVYWISDSENVAVLNHGGNAAAIGANSSYEPNYPQFPPTLLRTSNATNIRLVNLLPQSPPNNWAMVGDFEPHENLTTPVHTLTALFAKGNNPFLP